MKESKHKLTNNVDNPNRYLCSVCGDSFVKTDPAFQHWLAVGCLPKPHGNRVCPIEVTPHLGNQCTHSTHNIGNFKDLIYCTKCGNIGRHHLNKLSQPCCPPGKYGKHILRQIRAGIMPPASDTYMFAFRNAKALNRKRKYTRVSKHSCKRICIPESNTEVQHTADLPVSLIPPSDIPIIRYSTNFDDSEVESWINEDEEPQELPPGLDMEVESVEAEPPLLPLVLTSPTYNISRIPTPFGFCPECGDSLMTPMHVAG